MIADLEQYRSTFAHQAQEQLGRIERSLRALQVAPEDRAALDAAFRAVHTLKAMSATMGYNDITRAAHSLEDRLAYLERTHEPPTQTTLHLLFDAVEELNGQLRRIEADVLWNASGVTPSGGNASTDASAERLFSSPNAFSPQVRVRQKDLNLLLELVAELAVSSNQLEHTATEYAGANAEAVVRQQRELVRELRRLTWQLNMAPIGPVWEHYARVLHELARQQDKSIRVVTHGAEVELCHAMLDALNEPLLHLLRNAVTHGIELPAERAWAGKDTVGSITLRAQRAGDRILIQVADDGRGMDAGEILQTAYAQGLITREQRAAMTAQDAYRLILLPNFSMARTVTPNAGRGIGMSVAKAQLDAVGGRLDIQSAPGQGTTFTLDVPRLIGLIEVELVRAGKRIYGIPTSSIAAARVWLPSEIAAREKSAGDSAPPEWRILDVTTFKRVYKNQLTMPAGVCLVELHSPLGAMLRVDELLGKALLNYPFALQPAAIPILDPATLFTT